MNVYQAEGKTKSDDSNGAPGGTKYLGCFKDDRDDRVLTLALKSHDDMTPKVSGGLLVNSPVVKPDEVRVYTRCTAVVVST